MDVFDNQSNLSTALTCEERRLIGSSFLPVETEEAFAYILAVFRILVFPFSISLNSLLVILIVKFKRLHQTTFYLALQLVIADLVTSLLTTPLTVANIFSKRWALEKTSCVLGGFVLKLGLHSRSWLMFTFVTDRFCTVFFPFTYFKHRNKIVTALSLGAWTIALIFSIVTTSLDCVGFSRATWYCSAGGGCTNPDACALFRSILIPLSYTWGSLIPLIMYIILFVKAKKLKNRVSPLGSDGTLEATIRREHKANVTFLLLFLSLFGVSILAFLFYIIGTSTFTSLGIRPPTEYSIVVAISINIYYTLPVMDAIAIMRNQDVRETLNSLVKKRRQGNETTSSTARQTTGTD